VLMVGEVCLFRGTRAAVGFCGGADGGSKGPWAAIKPPRGRERASSVRWGARAVIAETL